MLHSHHKCDAAHDCRYSSGLFAIVVRVTHTAMDVLCALSRAQLPLHFPAHWIAHIARTLVKKVATTTCVALPWMEQSWFAANADPGDEHGRTRSFLLPAFRPVVCVEHILPLFQRG